MQVYLKENVDAVIKSACALIEGLQGHCKQLQEELDAVKTASGERVELEKVASAVAPELAMAFAQCLADRNFIDPSMMDKYAAAVATSPSDALQFAMKAIKFSDIPSSEGYGITGASTKKASNKAHKTAYDVDPAEENEAYRAMFQN